MSLKLLLLPIICILLLFSNCSKNEQEELQYEATGMILGPDYALCPCCGGCILQIDNDSIPYRFEVFPPSSNIGCGDSIAVKFNWTFDRECDPFTYLIIDEIELN